MIVTRSNIEKGREALEHSELLYGDELYHYGRKGMKWYQHIFGAIDPRAKYKAYVEKKQKKKEFKEREKRKTKAPKIPYKDPEGTRGPFKTDSESNEALAKRIQAQKDYYDKTDKDGGFDEKSFDEYRIDKEIARKSGDWYWSEGVSEAFKKNREESRKIMDKIQDIEKKFPIEGPYGTKTYEESWKRRKEALKPYREMADQLEDDLIGVVLKDLGYRDTQEARKILRPWVIYD